MNLYQNILDDLKRTTPLDPVVFNDPYNPDQDVRSNVRRIYHQLLRTVRSRDRILSLVNAYYLGKIMEVHTDTSERTMAKAMITPHYFRSTRKLFLLFEPLGVEQIYRTKTIKIAHFGNKLTYSQWQQLREEAIQEAMNRFD